MIAKGAQRPKSRFGGILESFTEGTAQIFLKEGRDLQTLSGFDLIRSRQSLGRDLIAFSGASLIAELVLRFATDEPQPQLFDTAIRALDDISSAEPGGVEATVISDVWVLVSQLGFRPQLERCVGCSAEVAEDEPVRFDVEGGGVTCLRCRPHGRILDPQSRRELLQMTDGTGSREPFTSPSLQRALVRVFLSSHLSRDYPLRSLDLFLQHLER